MKPLNIWSRSDEEIGRLASNFAHTPFTLNGVEYASTEALYVALLIASEEKRAKVRKMWGIRAKHECPKIKPESIEYRGAKITLGSNEHHDLIKAAIRAKLTAHAAIAAAFVATRPRPLVLETGYPDWPDAEFPHRVFCRILTELREEFAATVTGKKISCPSIRNG